MVKSSGKNQRASGKVSLFSTCLGPLALEQPAHSPLQTLQADGRAVCVCLLSPMSVGPIFSLLCFHLHAEEGFRTHVALTDTQNGDSALLNK